MEDNELWKRHLLGLVTQVVLAVYVVAKSWHSNNRLLGPVMLMFFSGTVKYAERTWALKMATPATMIDNRMSDLHKTMATYHPERSQSAVRRYEQGIVGRRGWWLEEKYADLVLAAGDSFPNCINALMDIPVAPWLLPKIWGMIEQIVMRPRPATTEGGKDGFPPRAYKMGEIQLSIMYDHLYTKVGLRSYCFLHAKLGASRFTQAIFFFIKLVRPYHKPLWSNKWAQHNLLAGCIREKQAGIVTRMMRYTGLVGDTKHCRISDETKELICNELDDQRRLQQFSHVRGQGILSLRGHSRHSDLYKSIDKVDFATSVVMWHVVTDVCFLLDKGGGGRHMLLARGVSNYLMALVMERRVLMSSEGHVAHRKVRDELKDILAQRKDRIDADNTDDVKRMLEAGVHEISDPVELGEGPGGVDMVFARNSYETMRPVLPRAWRLAQMPLREHGQEPGPQGEGGGGPWELMASVWMEMLFHLATRCEAGFHAKNLSTGGEFITHVRFLLLNRGIGCNFVLGHA